ncbi:MAG TPA: site-2 protease family protein [Candidatus Saccharimonadales bacterium]|jgi:Zn-dependent protease/predicted transcriptional regulator|nr:site-2 protease family protein [Candidatus Saccharimonadales bacterium]
MIRNWSISAGRIFGIEVRIHLTFFFLVFLVLMGDAPPAGVVRSAVLVALIFASVGLHEFGHAMAALRSGVAVRGILLLPLGGLTLADSHEQFDERKESAREFRAAFAGPLVNAALALGTGALLLRLEPSAYLWAKPWVTTRALDRSFFWINLLLFAFNLLPAFPLDGGRALRSWLARRMDFQLASRRAVTIGNVFAAAFMLAGAYWSYTSLIVLGFFMFMGAQMEERSLMFQSVVESVNMEDIMLTHFSTLSPADTLEDALYKAVHSLQDDFPVVRGADLVGVINRQTIVERLRQEGNGYVQGAMNKAFEIASRTESLSSAFRKLTGRGLTLIPVVDQERLVGIVTLQNLMHSMGLLAESRRLKRQMEEM